MESVGPLPAPSSPRSASSQSDVYAPEEDHTTRKTIMDTYYCVVVHYRHKAQQDTDTNKPCTGC